MEWVETGKVRIAMRTYSMAVGMLPVELLAHQVQCSVMQIGQDSPIDILHQLQTSFNIRLDV